jgi:hypothetical protein
VSALGNVCVGQEFAPDDPVGIKRFGPSDVQLTLNRPIKFDHIQCVGLESARISVSWVGNQP